MRKFLIWHMLLPGKKATIQIGYAYQDNKKLEF